MAVSQYLRPQGLVDAARSYLTPDAIRSTSSAIGEPESATQQALFTAIPTVLSGVTRISSSPSGAGGVVNLLREGGLQSLTSNPSAVFSGSASSKVADLGPQLLSRIFGGKSTAVADAVANSSGVKASSANRVLAMAAPLTMSVLGHHVAAQGLNASGLSSLLSDQADEIDDATPPEVLRVLDSSPTAVVPPPNRPVIGTQREGLREVPAEYSSPRRPHLEERSGGSGKWLPWLLLLLVGLGLLVFMRGRAVRHAADLARQGAGQAGQAIGSAAEQAEGALTSITLPGGVHLSVPSGSIGYNLAAYLGSPAPTPRTFVFDHLNFESSSADLTPESVPTVNALATVLKAYPDSRVQLAGYTDNTGDPDANRRLSLDRANAVKAMLTQGGVAPDRIVAVGLGQDHPVASNDDDAGRARNRRLELTVTSK